MEVVTYLAKCDISTVSVGDEVSILLFFYHILTLDCTRLFVWVFHPMPSLTLARNIHYKHNSVDTFQSMLLFLLVTWKSRSFSRNTNPTPFVPLKKYVLPFLEWYLPLRWPLFAFHLVIAPHQTWRYNYSSYHRLSMSLLRRPGGFPSTLLQIRVTGKLPNS